MGDTVEGKTHGLGQGEESKLESESVGAGCLWPGQETGTWIVPPDLWTELLCPAYLTYLQDPPTQGQAVLTQPGQPCPVAPLSSSPHHQLHSLALYGTGSLWS